MQIRRLLFENLSWKFLSLGIAILVWYGARLFMREDISPLVSPLQPYGTRDFPNLPVRVLASAKTNIPVRIHPPSILVRVGGDITLLDRITQQDVVAFVDLTDPPVDSPTTNRVELRLPPSVRFISTIPERVVVSPAPPANAQPKQPFADK